MRWSGLSRDATVNVYKYRKIASADWAGIITEDTMPNVAMGTTCPRDDRSSPSQEQAPGTGD
jgi:hypothetical protein